MKLNILPAGKLNIQLATNNLLGQIPIFGQLNSNYLTNKSIWPAQYSVYLSVY